MNQTNNSPQSVAYRPWDESIRFLLETIVLSVGINVLTSSLSWWVKIGNLVVTVVYAAVGHRYSKTIAQTKALVDSDYERERDKQTKSQSYSEIWNACFSLKAAALGKLERFLEVLLILGLISLTWGFFKDDRKQEEQEEANKRIAVKVDSLLSLIKTEDSLGRSLPVSDTSSVSTGARHGL